jgi:hypothetical protein
METKPALQFWCCVALDLSSISTRILPTVVREEIKPITLAIIAVGGIKPCDAGINRPGPFHYLTIANSESLASYHGPWCFCRRLILWCAISSLR